MFVKKLVQIQATPDHPDIFHAFPQSVQYLRTTARSYIPLYSSIKTILICHLTLSLHMIFFSKIISLLHNSSCMKSCLSLQISKLETSFQCLCPTALHPLPLEPSISWLSHSPSSLYFQFQ
jgi:hypothetical protein